MLLTPGHAPAHQSVPVRLPESGPLVVCGDATYTQANLDAGSWDGQADPEAAAASASAAKLQRVAEQEGATLLFRGWWAGRASWPKDLRRVGRPRRPPPAVGTDLRLDVLQAVGRAMPSPVGGVVSSQT